MKETPNTGQTGIESIRIAGMTLDNLPIAEAAEAKEQLPEAIKNDKESRIEGIKKRYPQGSVTWHQSRIKEAKKNIQDVENLKQEQADMINDYTGHISLCKHRDKLLETANEEEAKDLYKQFPPYNVEAMEQQIKQCEQAMKRCDVVVKQEYDSIAQMEKVVTLCEERDKEIAKIK